MPWPLRSSNIRPFSVPTSRFTPANTQICCFLETHDDSVSCQFVVLSPLTPESRTEDLRVEALLVLSNLGRVAVRSDVGRVHVDHGDLPGLVEPRLLLLLFQELISKQRCGTTNKPTRHGFGVKWTEGSQ